MSETDGRGAKRGGERRRGRGRDDEIWKGGKRDEGYRTRGGVIS